MAKGKIRVVDPPTATLWVESLCQNERLVNSFKAYMDDQVRMYEGMVVDAVRDGDSGKAARLAGAVDMLNLLRLRVLNRDGEAKAREKVMKG